MAIIRKFLRGQANQPTRLLATYKTAAENVLDFSLPDHGVEPGDVVLAIALPVNAIVTRVRYEIIENEGNVSACSIGDDLDPDAWELNVNLNNIPGNGLITVCSTGTVPVAGIEKHYPQPTGAFINDSISLVISSEPVVNAKIWVSAEYYIKELFENE